MATNLLLLPAPRRVELTGGSLVLTGGKLVLLDCRRSEPGTHQ